MGLPDASAVTDETWTSLPIPTQQFPGDPALLMFVTARRSPSPSIAMGVGTRHQDLVFFARHEAAVSGHTPIAPPAPMDRQVAADIGALRQGLDDCLVSLETLTDDFFADRKANVDARETFLSALHLLTPADRLAWYPGMCPDFFRWLS